MKNKNIPKNTSVNVDDDFGLYIANGRMVHLKSFVIPVRYK